MGTNLKLRASWIDSEGKEQTYESAWIPRQGIADQAKTIIEVLPPGENLVLTIQAEGMPR